MPQASIITEEPRRVRRVFGFFVFAAVVGLAYSLLAPPAPGPRAGLGRPSEADAMLAYAACQDGVRTRSLRGAQLRFPDAAESFGRADGNQWAIVSRVVVAPPSGTPFAQRFACRVQRFGAGPATVWRVARLRLDMPAA